VVNLGTPDDHEVDDDLDTITQDLKLLLTKNIWTTNFWKWIKQETILIWDKRLSEIQDLITMGYFQIMIRLAKLMLILKAVSKTLPLRIRLTRMTCSSKISLETWIWVGKKSWNSNVDDDDIHQTAQVIDFSYFHAQGGELKWIINDTGQEHLPKDGSEWMTRNLNMNNNKIINVKLQTTADNAANKECVDTEISNVDSSCALLLDSSKKMTGILNMNNKKVVNVMTDLGNPTWATNIDYVDTKANESHITSYDSKKHVFRYLTKDENESLSEDKIKRIKDFAVSPRSINKKAYVLRMGKSLQNWYSFLPS